MQIRDSEDEHLNFTRVLIRYKIHAVCLFSVTRCWKTSQTDLLLNLWRLFETVRINIGIFGRVAAQLCIRFKDI